jgi:hypothetical protein
MNADFSRIKLGSYKICANLCESADKLPLLPTLIGELHDEGMGKTPTYREKVAFRADLR